MNLSDLTEAEFSVIEKLFGDWFFFLVIFYFLLWLKKIPRGQDFDTLISEA